MQLPAIPRLLVQLASATWRAANHQICRMQANAISSASFGPPAGGEEYCTLRVRAGDCLSEIARMCGTPVDDIARLNRIKDAECLMVGQTLLIPRSRRQRVSAKRRPPFWQIGKTKERWAIANLGDSLWSLADAYQVNIEDIRQANGLPQNSSHLDVGQEVLIPHPKKTETLSLKLSGAEVWAALKQWRIDSALLPLHFAMRTEVLKSMPVVGSRLIMPLMPLWKPEAFGLPVRGGWLSSYYGWKDGRCYFHNGIDIAVEEGTPVVAATSGKVTFSNWKGGYGKTVCMDHGNGHTTLYAHNDQLLVKAGQLVRKGQPIALSGNTGHSTGPHLHFEVHRDGLSIDPLGVIPPID